MPYKAFISYSHAADDALAPALQHALQTLARPWNRRRALEIFRDDTGLAVSPGLWSSICAALDDSEYFVLLASPEAAASIWVNREIEYWTAQHPLDKLLPVLTGGEWGWDPLRGDFDRQRSTAVPSSLVGRFPEEPRHLDLRWARGQNDLDLRNSRFREAVAQLAAPMHSMTPEDLESADVTHYRHVVRLRRAVIAAMAALLVLVSVAGVLAIRNTREAQRQQARADENAVEAGKNAEHALALQLLAQAEVLGDQQKTLSLLLRLEAAKLAPTEAWGSLVDGLADVPGLAKVYDLPTGVRPSEPIGVDPASKLLATSVGSSGAIRLWDFVHGKPTGRPLHRPENVYPRLPTQMVFSPAGELAARYVCPPGPRCGKHRASKISLWNVSAREPSVLSDSKEYADPSFSQDGRSLVAIAPDGQARVWDVRTAKASATVGRPEAGGSRVAISADGRMVALARQNAGRIELWRTDRASKGPARVVSLPRGEHPIQVALGPTRSVVALTEDGVIRVWDARTGDQRGTLSSSPRAVGFTVGPDGYIAVVGADGQLRLSDLGTLAPLGQGWPTGVAQGSLVRLVYGPERQLISLASDIRAWDTARWGQTGETLYRHPAPVTAVASNSSGVLASADSRGDISLSEVQPSGSDRRLVHSAGGSVTALALSDGGVLASGGADGKIRLWDVESGRVTDTLRTSGAGRVVSLAFDADADQLAAGYAFSGRRPRPGWVPILVWDVAQGRVVQSKEAGLEANVTGVTFGPHDLFGASGSDHLTLWDTRTWESRVLMQGRQGQFASLAFDPTSTLIAASGHQLGHDRTRTLLIWDTTKDSRQRAVPLGTGTAEGWDGRFTGLAFSPDGTLLAGAGPGGLQLWDMVRRQPLGGLLKASPSSSVVATPDGQHFVVADEDGRVEEYPAALDSWRASTCAVISRNLTRAEWQTYLAAAGPYEKTCPQYPGQ